MDTYQDIINQIKPDLDAAMEHFKRELIALRTGRATPALVEDVEVECYGSKMKLKELAAIYTPEPRLILIQPWDKNILKEIEKAIAAFRSGLSPIIDGEIIRLNIPSLTEERRNELVRVLHQKNEEARISARLSRDKVWKDIQGLVQAGQIREDDKFRAKDFLQKLIDEYNGKIKELTEVKEKEILTV